MKEINLTKNKIALVDDDDFEKLSKFKWYAHKSRTIFYAERHINSNGKRTTIRMHRFLMEVPKEKEVDHIDGNGLNNQKSNLRICSRQENLRNQKLSVRNKSGFKGVSWSSRTKKWVSQIGITINKKETIKNLGYFKSKEEAAKTYDNAAKELFGEFAKLNFK